MTDAVHNVIGGQTRETIAGATTELVDPSTGEVCDTAPLSTVEDVDAAYRAAVDAFEVWRDTTPGQRQVALLRCADALERRAAEFVAAECRDTGKPTATTLSDEVLAAVDALRFFAGAARVLPGVGATEYAPGHTSYVRREPVGVVGQVAPWNYPLLMAMWKIAPALAAGNTVVLKPADTTPVTAVMFGVLAAEFLPAGVLNVVCGDRDTGRAVVAHPAAAMVSITGSTRAGVEVARSAADRVARTHLELGGNAPVVVFADADLDAAVEGIVATGFFNAGQDCTAASRVLVDRRVHDEFAARLAERARTVHTGPPSDPTAHYGPLNNADQFARVRAILDGLPDHARITAGGEAVGERGYFLAPTVVTGVRQDDAVVQQENFGPVLTVQPFTDEAHALRLACGVEQGLAASVWTSDHGRALRMSARLDFGCVWINTHMVLVPEMPHGGFKQSGYGKDLSQYSLEEYTRVKHVMHKL
ncbi:gamma-aminobutyraldehyde dehydrogenase [Actinosynnema sp. NPDC047251]|uniref:Gamma-aminobutyraldehyde dehydrogenase n=1 Tax=Saccharothrix espanaensis (strain ATCC 51144 / DSM 44229 / JCM 9112 / NBRC 15066 / NRRL 15764) TaxID=1179773 RepID=K0K5C8_SACES|nr:gamma-aminobutyraldehyde dehydrogenase [Saccharothrix espanaensis]CCH31748.1 gamma-aminobutyraldehyde dehydrogenase [Saccharothrix espanaensis DSM 44229]